MPSSARGQAALHATAAEEYRNAALDSSAEALTLFEFRSVLQRFALGGFLPAPLRDADAIDAFLFAAFDVVGAVRAAVVGIEFGSTSEHGLVGSDGFHSVAAVFQCLFGNADQFPVFGNLLVLPL